MKILVLSDSHGVLGNMEQAVAWEQPDMVFHLGDCYPDGQKLQGFLGEVPLVGVPGNCDLNVWDIPLTKVETVDSATFLLTHGHAYGVKSTLLKLELAARERGVTVALFGHTHQALVVEKDGLWLMNPGTCRSQSHWSYGNINLEHGKVCCQIKKPCEGEI